MSAPINRWQNQFSFRVTYHSDAQRIDPRAPFRPYSMSNAEKHVGIQLFVGGCLCGLVRFEATGAPKWTAYCHCRSCRRHTGAPVSAYAGFAEERLSWLHLTDPPPSP